MKGKKILLVEDDSFLMQLYNDILSEEKYHITTSTTGKDALKKIKLGGWDLVLLDVMLPEINGTEIMKTLSSDKDFRRDFPIVFLTNMDGSAELDKLSSMVDDVWIKSNLTPAEVIEKVQDILKK